jgi:hypothetical protein
MALLPVLMLAFPGRADAGPALGRASSANVAVRIAFGQESGNIRPFRVTIAGNGTIQPSGPIHLSGPSRPIPKDAVAALVVLAAADGFRTLPSFTACAGVLPDIATRYVNIRAPAWKHNASVRGNCLEGMNQLFAVLMNTTHASY